MKFEYVGSFVLDIKDPCAGLEPGSFVNVQYFDHCFFKNAEIVDQKPLRLEAAGIIDFIDPEYLRLRWQRYQDREGRTLGIGLVIIRSTILKVERHG